MLDLAQGVREQIIKETAPKVPVPKRFTMRTLRRALAWGIGAAAALALAVLSSRSQVGTARLADVFRINRTQVAAAPSFDPAAETKRLADAIQSLAADNRQVRSRLAAVEHNMDDVTGSLSKEIEAAAVAHRNEDGPTVAATASVSATMTPFATTPPPIVSQPPATIQARTDATVPAPSQIAYGVDIASGQNIAELRTRWTAIRNAHPQLFAGLEPVVNVKEAARGNRLELRLVVGPMAEAGDAAQLCAALASFALFCQPTMFDGQRLALR
jgi:hypothetical protein